MAYPVNASAEFRLESWKTELEDLAGYFHRAVGLRMIGAAVYYRNLVSSTQFKQRTLELGAVTTLSKPRISTTSLPPISMHQPPHLHYSRSANISYPFRDSLSYLRRSLILQGMKPSIVAEHVLDLQQPTKLPLLFGSLIHPINLYMAHATQ